MSDMGMGTNLSNWRQPPHSAWAFHHIDTLMPCARIAPADEPMPLPAAAAPAAFDGFHLTISDGSAVDFARFLELTATDGLVVLKDGAVVCEVYRNGMDAASPHILMSATKAVVGLLVGVLQGRGLLDVEAPVTQYVPEVAETAYRGATIRQLIDMRGGVVLEAADLPVYEAATGWVPTPPGEPADLHGFYRKMTAPFRPHGGPFRYVSANTDLVGWAIERAAGAPFAEEMSRHLWQPLGAAREAMITLDGHGAPRCTGGLVMAMRDFARLGQMVLDGGRVAGRDVVPASWIADLREGGDCEAWATGEWGKIFRFAGRKLSYRAGWYVVDDEPGLLFAMGIHGQNLFVDRANGLVIAKLSSQKDPTDSLSVPLTHKAVAEVRRLLVG